MYLNFYKRLINYIKISISRLLTLFDNDVKIKEDLILCSNCENKKIKKTFVVKDRGSGSLFDCMEIKIELCEDCIKKIQLKDEWFDEKPTWDGEYNNYKYENEIINLLEKLSNKPIILDRIICS